MRLTVTKGRRLSFQLVSTFVIAMLTLAAPTACTKKNEQSKQQSIKVAPDGKKIFYHYRTSAHKTLDPMKQFDAASAQIVQNLFDTLLHYSYLQRPYQLEPLLLEKMPEQQDDKVTYLFTLKKGVYFNDDPAFKDGKGRELKVDDVIYSIKRFADFSVNDLSYVLIAGMIEGLDQFRDKTEELSKKNKPVNYDALPVSGLKKLDDYRLQIKFTSDNPLVLYPLAFSGLSMVAREAVEKYGDQFQEHPVGTGPFYMKEYSRRGKMILAKNPRYHQTYPTEGSAEDKAAGLLDDAGKQLPFVDEVHLPLIEETQPAMLKFKNGDIYWIAMNKDEFNNLAYKDKNDGKFHLKKPHDEQYNIYDENYLSTEYFKFGMRDKIVGSNKALRQAIAYALNQEDFIDLMFNGRAMASSTIVPLPIAGSQRQVGDYWYEYNKEMAKKKLAEAGYPGGKGLPELVIEYRSTSKDVRQYFEYIRNELAQVGIKVVGNFQTFSNFLKKTNAGNFQIASAGWAADYPDAENFYQLLYSKNKAPGPNDGNYENKKYDELFEKAKFMPNGPERFELFKQMNEIVKEDVPVILRYNQIAVGLLQKNVRNFKRNMMHDFPYKYYNLEMPQTKKAEEKK